MTKPKSKKPVVSATSAELGWPDYHQIPVLASAQRRRVADARMGQQDREGARRGPDRCAMNGNERHDGARRRKTR